MTAGSDTVPLGAVLRHRKEFITIDDLGVYRRPRVQLHARGIVLRDTIPGALIKTKQQQVCRSGEFLVAEIDAKVGGFGIVPPEMHGAVVSSHYFLFAVNPARLDSRYLDFYSRTPSFREQIEAQGSTNYAAIRPADVLSYRMPLPPLAEQKRIVARVEEVAARISEAHALRERAANEREILRVTGAAGIFGAMADDRAMIPLGELVEIRGGGTPSKSNPSYWLGSVPWITPKDMKVRELYGARDHISEQATLDSPAHVNEPGSVLIVVRGMILAHTVPSAILRVRAAINQDMKVLTPNASVAVEFLCGFLWIFNQQLLTLVRKSSHDTRKLETSALLQTLVPLPSIPEQRRIVAELETFDSQLAALHSLQVETAAELEALLPSILDRAFRGDL